MDANKTKIILAMGLRMLTGAISGFIAFTAVAGGLALLFGGEGRHIPLRWLKGTPFADYTIPALLLVIAVGGSALAASVMIFAGNKFGALTAMAAGLIMMGYITVEVFILKQVPPGPTAVEMFYFGLGLILFLLGGTVRLSANSYSRRTTP